MTMRHRLLLILMFNLIPVGFVAMGAWREFDVVAFYWVEVIAAGIFAFARQAVMALAKFGEGKKGEGIGGLTSLVFMPVHYGFFVVMMAFMVGGFLPDSVPKVKLTGPLVPAEVVIANMEFMFAFIIAAVWQSALFLADRLAPEGTREEVNPMLRAYGQMFVLFAACFAGMVLGGVLDSKIWGAAALIVIKTAAAMLVATATEDKATV
jgi:Family of unknown function (DUF6498)